MGGGGDGHGPAAPPGWGVKPILLAQPSAGWRQSREG